MEKLKIREWLDILKKTTAKWWKSDPFRQSAVIAYYAIFSLPALLVIVVHLAGVAFGQAAVSGQVAGAISDTLGQSAALEIQDILVKVSRSSNSFLAAVIGLGTLLFGATGVFIELQKSLNYVWEVQAPAGKSVLQSLKDRLFSFGLILSVGFLLAVSLVITSLLTAFSGLITARFSVLTTFLLHGINLLLSMSIISVLFALMFKILPDVRTRWAHIWPGAGLTGFLFIIGKYALGFYFGKFQPASVYGAAGSVVLILLWVSYSCMILFFGAEFTRQYSLKKEGHLVLKKNALMQPGKSPDLKTQDQ